MDDQNPVMRGITWFAEHFIGLFQAAAEQFTGLVTGILPLLMVMLTFMYAITTWIGEERVTRAIRWAGRWAMSPRSPPRSPTPASPTRRMSR